MERVGKALLALLIILAVGAPHSNIAAAQGDSPFGYKITTDMVYGKGMVTRDGSAVSRDLWMDIYEPLKKATGPRPAVIMTFGGAFHRGSPRATFESGGSQDTSMSNYCRTFSALGYVCFAIDYRLTPEGSVLSGNGYNKDHIDPESLLTLLPQINHVRKEMNLPVVDFEIAEQRSIVVNGVIGAAEDLSKAVAFIRKSAATYKIDPDRIVLGGFSAGAITSWNVAHGMGAPVAGVFLLSGVNAGFDIEKTVTTASNRPPILLVLGQNDLPDGLAAMPSLLKHYRDAGVQHSFAWVPGFGHFYPAGATSLGTDGSKMSVEARVIRFLGATVGKP